MGKAEDLRETQVFDPEEDPQDSKKRDSIWIRQRNMSLSDLITLLVWIIVKHQWNAESWSSKAKDKMESATVLHVEVRYCWSFVNVPATIDDPGLAWQKSMQGIKKCLELRYGCFRLDSLYNTSGIEQSFEVQSHKDYKQLALVFIENERIDLSYHNPWLILWIYRVVYVDTPHSINVFSFYNDSWLL